MKIYRTRRGGCCKPKCAMRGNGLNLPRAIGRAAKAGVKWIKNPRNRSRYVYPLLFRAGMSLL